MAKVVPFSEDRLKLQDVLIRNRIAENIEWTWPDVKVEPIPGRNAPISWVMKRNGRPWCVASFKHLKQPFRHFRVYEDGSTAAVPDEILYDIEKYDAGWKLAYGMGLKCSLAVRAWYDRVGWCDLRDVNPNHNRWIRNIRQPDRTWRKCDTFTIPLEKWEAIFYHDAETWLGVDKEARQWSDKPGTDAQPGGPNREVEEVPGAEGTPQAG